MDNESIKNILNDLKNSQAVIINSEDTMTHIKEKYGNKYIEDLSDSEDESLSYKKRNSNIIKKISEKTNEEAKKKNLNADNFTISTITSKNKKSVKNKKEKNKMGEFDELNNSEDDTIEEYEFQEDFEKQVKTYVKSDDKIKELQKEIKELSQIKKVSEDAIMKHLERLGDTNINITGGKLILNKYDSKASFKEETVKEVLKKEINDDKKIDNIMTKIDEIRIENAKKQIGLKRTSCKKK